MLYTNQFPWILGRGYSVGLGDLQKMGVLYGYLIHKIRVTVHIFMCKIISDNEFLERFFLTFGRRNILLSASKSQFGVIGSAFDNRSTDNILWPK